jgi:cyclohexanone monooxygenase
MIMKCEPTRTPEDVDIPAMRERYAREREKRLRKDGHGQYLRTEGAFAAAYENDPHMPVAPRAAITEDLDVAIVGAGWSGILTAYHLEQSGVSFGGVWYWNRDPGVQCGNDAYCSIRCSKRPSSPSWVATPSLGRYAQMDAMGWPS